MVSPLGFWSAVCALTVFVGMSTARAASGRIVLSGAVVEPTCAAAELGYAEATGPAAQRLACGRTASDAGRSYTREVIDLAAANRHHDRLLDYFASYAPRSDDGNAAARVVVHTYD
jgi:hypothetical protein